MTHRKLFQRLNIVSLCLVLVLAASERVRGQRIAIFEEGFEGLELGPVDDEPVPLTFPEAFTSTPPAGWSKQFSQTPAGSAPGTTEWRGWSFANPTFWSTVGGDDRQAFEFGTGNVIAVADGDMFEDALGDQGQLNAFLRTPPISLNGVAANQAIVEFDSSWRAKGTQVGVLNAIYDGGTPVELFRWESNPFSFNFKPDSNPGFEFVSLNNPSGANQVVLEFAYLNAGDDFWWAVDNIEVRAGESLFSEDFESLALGPAVDAPVFGGDVDKLWTRSGPTGWIVNNSGVPGVGKGDDRDGVDEWAGWSFADKGWWIANGMNQGRSEFKLGQGTVAVADPGQWDDLPHDPSAANGWYRTTLVTPPISLEHAKAETVELEFANSWRPADDENFRQSARILVSFDGGTPIPLTQWISHEVDGQQQTDVSVGGEMISVEEFGLINTTERLMIPNPFGATEMVLTFEMFDAGNDWWWAIDNLKVTAEDRGSGIFGDFDNDSDVDSNDLLFFIGNWTGAIEDGGLTFTDGDSDDDGDVDSNDLLAFIGAWTGTLNAERSAEQFGSGLEGIASGDGVSLAAAAGVSRTVAVPEPGSLALMLLGLAALAARRRRG